MYDTVTESRDFTFEIEATLSGSLSDIVKSTNFSGSFNKTTKRNNILGIKGLSFSSTKSQSLRADMRSVFKNSDDDSDIPNKVLKYEESSSLSIDYERKINEDFNFAAGASYCNGKITVGAMIEHSSGFGIGLETNVTLNPLSLMKNGVFLVGSIPFFGMQLVVKYNPVTQVVVVQLRVPLPDDNEEDKKGGSGSEAGCGCPIIYVTVDVIAATMTEPRIYQYDNMQHWVNSICL
ncbi:hypothetical protein FO519_001395 [Halicephalobus sp. NKZ332]|nr:hypothetical protein FO519_001395 [Halicephalobus sp. NKZ332]